MNAVESLNSKMFDVIKKCIGKQVILYGYGKSGIFIEWLCSHVYGKKFTLVIDDKKVIPGINLHRKIMGSASGHRQEGKPGCTIW